MSTKIEKVPNQVKFPELEDNINKFWKENKIFEKSVEQKDKENPYVFVDGPPFVSGLPHYGHLITSIAKDVVPRYWTMKGKSVRRIFGWDCHGLPIEEKINKKFSITNRKQIENDFGIERYVQECRAFVEQCTTDWRWYIDKIGRWVDLDNAYYTMKPEFNESVIWAFKKIYEKDLIYKGKRVSLFSTDTSTPVSGFEVAMDPSNYRDTEDLSIFAKFKLKNSSAVELMESKSKFTSENIGANFDEDLTKVKEGKEIFFVAWTTTPWTIPSNFALGVNGKFSYVLVEFEGEYFFIAKDRLEYTFHTTSENIGFEEGKLVRVVRYFEPVEITQLAGHEDWPSKLEYEPIYDFFKGNKNDFKVYLSDDVTSDEGSGVLHIAPGFGEVDFNIGKKYELSDEIDIDEEGKMIVDKWKGVYLRDASPMVAEDMTAKGNLLRAETYKHKLPYYRGDNPLIYVAQEAYFINIQKVKPRMLELNEKVNWVPDHIKKGRFAQTLETSPDWCISRNRYWATIMPLWKSEGGDEIVVGSFEEMMQYTDQIEKREENGKAVYYFENQPMTLHRDVCDKLIFKKDGKEYRRVPEVMDCWLDSGSVPFAEYHYPFENVDTFEKARPADFIVEYTPQVRAWFNVLFRLATILFDDIPFKNAICHGTLAGNDGRKMSKSFGNYPDPKDVLDNIGGEAIRLYLMGSTVMVGGDMDWSDEVLSEQVKNILIPLWNTYKYLSIYAELHSWNPTDTKFNSKNILDKWLESYVNKVSLEYAKAMEAYDIPASVKLIQPAIDNISAWWIRRSRDRFVVGDVEALQTLYAAMVQITKTFAPQMPFVTEEIYQNLVVKTELKEAKESVHLEDFPEVDEKMIDEKLLTEMELVRRICTVGLKVRDDNRLKLRQPLAKAGVITNEKLLITNKGLEDIVKDELNVKELEFAKEFSGEFVSNTDGEITVGLDINLTSELKEEGLLNELQRGIQNYRKTAGLKMGELVNIQLRMKNEELRSIVAKYQKELSKSVSANSVEIVDSLENGTKVKVEGEEIEVGFVR